MLGPIGTALLGRSASEIQAGGRALAGILGNTGAYSERAVAAATKAQTAWTNAGSAGMSAATGGFGGVLGNLTGVGAAPYVNSAMKGALGFGAYGGASEWAQGGSFWEGAKAGAWRGAWLGAGSRAFRTGSTGSATAGYKKAWGQWGNVSKQVTAIARTDRAVALSRAANGLR